jgi:hypothetical protein
VRQPATQIFRGVTLISLLLVHLAILVLWWDSWHTLRTYVSSSQHVGFSSGWGCCIVNLRLQTSPNLPQGLSTGVGYRALPIGDFKIVSPPIRTDPLSSWSVRIPEWFEWEATEVPSHYVVRDDGTLTPLTDPDRYYSVILAHGVAAAVSGAAVWPWIGWTVYRRRRARRRDRAGLCPKCGYDVRANPTRCSECGYELKTVTVPAG